MIDLFAKCPLSRRYGRLWWLRPWVICFPGAGRGHEEMGSNLSKRRSQSSGNLSSASKLQDKYKLCGSLPNHLDLPNDNNNEPKDLGYGSEKSPEDEGRSPPFPACPVHHAHFIKKYPFINSNSVFWVTVKKGSGGLGLSVCGGEPWPGLIRIKRLFPHQPASHCGLLNAGDILLAASGVPLLGLTNYEALEVLRSAPAEVKLTVCRPPETVLPPVESHPPPPPPRDQPPLPPVTQYGEFEIVMEKMNGSLGFTLRKEDQSVLGHYVRALVREPALSDPRIRPGDKIVAVNDVDMSSLSHEEAVAYLRQCGSLVRLRLYRDPAQTPLQPHSPTHSHRTFKPILRKEAQDMLSELAVKKSQSPQDSSGSSKGSSPRKRRLTRTPPPADSIDSIDSTDETKPHRPEQLRVIDEQKKNYHFSQNLAAQSSEEELIGGGLCGSEPLPNEPVSMPPLGSIDQDTGFSYRNPAYRSANPPQTRPLVPQEINETGCSEQDIPTAIVDGGGTKGLLKWKGVLFPENENGPSTSNSQEEVDSVVSSQKLQSLDEQEPPQEQPEYQVVIVELNRGWNSRLGFSLQPSSDGGSFISAIYPDSVASRDGRLRIGDRIINVNDEGIEEMSTADVIDLLRKIRGSISLTLLRKSQ